MPIKRNKIEKYLKKPLTVRVFDEIDSTNNEAKRRAAEDCSSCILYAADCQTSGRGRRGHDFYSPKGSGVYFTLALPVCGDPADVQMLTCAAGVAVCEAIKALSGKKPQIKWVNDVYLDGKKVAGILAELVLDQTNRPISVIVGVGINLTTQTFPAEFASKAGSIGDIDPSRLCAEVVNRLIEMYVQPENYSESELKQHYNSIIEKYAALNFCIGRQVRFSDSEGEHLAEAVEIAPDGCLIVEEHGRKKSLRSGEISIVVSDRH